jgi:retinol dehydrogenase 12
VHKFWAAGTACISKNRLDGKVAIVTGANTGIGYETALDFAKRGSRVILACRDIEKAKKSVESIIISSKNKNVDAEKLDLADMSSITDFCRRMNTKLTRLDILVNNAGIATCPYWKTKDNFEMQFGTNHLGHFLLTNLLLDLLKSTPSSRVVNVSSRAHKRGIGMNWDDLMWEKRYHPMEAYAQSKLANILFTKELAKRLEGTSVTTYSLHPGVVRTELTRYMGQISIFIPLLGYMLYPFFMIVMKSCYEGAQTTIHCSVSDDVLKYNGCYFS